MSGSAQPFAGLIQTDDFMPLPPPGQATLAPSSGLPMIMLAASPVTGLLQPYLNGGRPRISFMPYSATPIFDGSLGQNFGMVLTGNVAPSFINMVNNSDYSLYFIQDSTGNHTITWPVSWTWLGGSYVGPGPGYGPNAGGGSGTAASQTLSINLNLIGTAIVARSCGI